MLIHLIYYCIAICRGYPMNRVKKLMASVLMFAIMAAVFAGCSSKQIPAGLKVGDVFEYGSYGGSIEWQVLDIQDGKAFVIASKALDAKVYNEDYVDITWNLCTLRTWLNNDFMNSAFSSSEKSAIVLSKVENKDNPDYNTPGGEDTEDYIFLLSIDEAKKYFTTEEARKATATEKADKDGVKVRGGYCNWTLRSPGYTALCSAGVGADGYVYTDGSYISVDSNGIRPAMWVTLPAGS